MPRENDNPHVEAAPHFDGAKESVINDPTASAGSKIGIQLDNKVEFGQERHPTSDYPEADPEMKKFEKLMRGKKIED